jgi:energy-converting hydrogenase Eha subunit B
LRNKVVVYGTEGVYAKAQASSPYLPGGFFKSVVFASPTLVANTAMAQSIANYNLAKLNRLTIGGSATIIGNHAISCRDCVNVNKSDIGMTGQFYVYGLEHSWSKDGFTTSLDLRK